LRSTPWPFWRVSAARPSGFRVGTSHMSNMRGGRTRRRRRITATPAHSLPWMQPTTSTRRGACGAPDSVAMIARPPAEVPICCVTCTDGPYGPTVISGSAASSAGSAGTAPSYAVEPLGHLRRGGGGDGEEEDREGPDGAHPRARRDRPRLEERPARRAALVRAQHERGDERDERHEHREQRGQAGVATPFSTSAAISTKRTSGSTPYSPVTRSASSGEKNARAAASDSHT